MTQEMFPLMGFVLLWYTISSLANIVGKRLLTIFPYPFTVTLVQLFYGWLYSIPLLRWLNIPKPIYLYTKRIYYSTVILPLAIGKMLSQLTSQISLRLVPVSYSHTIKALMPLFTVFLSKFVLGENQSITIYFTLLPIVVGVIIASISEISFDLIGFVSALFSTAVLATQNIYSKKIFTHIEIHHLALLSVLCKLSWCLLVPFWFLLDGSQIDFKREFTVNVIGLMFFDSLFNFLYNVLAFTMISRLSPLSYAIAGSAKRVIVIVVSILVFHNPVTKTNWIGIGLAIFGVLLYNRIKYDEKKKQDYPTRQNGLLLSSSIQPPLSSPPLTQNSMSNNKSQLMSD